MNCASVLNLDPSTGNIIIMAMSWDNYNNSNYAIQGYSPDGSVLYTIDYGEPTDNLTGKNNINAAKDDLSYKLSQNYPNPFNPNTVINYKLGTANYVTLKIFDSRGKEVAALVNERQNAGSYSVNFNGAGYPSGVYFYRLEADGNIIDARRMILLK
jgi:hypothetical protein